jgi:hypothetical protein
MAPTGTTTPYLWNPQHDEAQFFLLRPLEFPRGTNIDTYYAMVCLRSIEVAMETISSITSTPDEKALSTQR